MENCQKLNVVIHHFVLTIDGYSVVAGVGYWTTNHTQTSVVTSVVAAYNHALTTL